LRCSRFCFFFAFFFSSVLQQGPFFLSVKYNDMKLHFIKEKIPDGSGSTVYRCGPLIDLCLGPHVPNTNRVKAYSIYRNASSYWLGKSENEVLQRVYGISFSENKQLAEWQQWREEAKKRDHRLVGRNQELFFFHELSPGSCFFLPHGARIYNTLITFIRVSERAKWIGGVVLPFSHFVFFFSILLVVVVFRVSTRRGASAR